MLVAYRQAGIHDDADFSTLVIYITLPPLCPAAGVPPGTIGRLPVCLLGAPWLCIAPPSAI